VKPAVDRLTTVPDDPPAALPAAVAEGDVTVADDVPQAAASPITTAAMIHRLLPFVLLRLTIREWQPSI
jgi:hypothetical protein